MVKTIMGAHLVNRWAQAVKDNAVRTVVIEDNSMIPFFKDLVITDEIACKIGTVDPQFKTIVEVGAFGLKEGETKTVPILQQSISSGKPLGEAVCYEDASGLKVNATLKGSAVTHILEVSGYTLTASVTVLERDKETGQNITKMHLDAIGIWPKSVESAAEAKIA